jgi:transketolase
LKDSGVGARVLSMHTVKPLDVDAVARAARECRLVVSVEEHTVVGGLGGAIAEVLAELDGPRARFRRLGVPSVFTSRVGSQEWLRGVYGLSPDAVLASVKGWLAEPDQGAAAQPAR